jgi:hypothetical protein
MPLPVLLRAGRSVYRREIWPPSGRSSVQRVVSVGSPYASTMSDEVREEVAVGSRLLIGVGLWLAADQKH